MTTEPEIKPTITKVWAKNFRSIEYAELELDPLTVLVGPNASGKSNLLDVLGFLADAVRDGLETTITRRGGIVAIGRRSPSGRVLSPEIGFRYELPEGVLEYSVALVRRRNGEYRVKHESTRLNPAGSGDDHIIEVELNNGRLTKPNLKDLLKQAQSTQNEGRESASNYVSIVNQLIDGLDTQHLLLITEEPSLATMLLEMLLSQSNSSESIPSLHLLRQALFNTRRYLREIGLYHIIPSTLRYPLMVADLASLASTLRDIAQKKSRFWQELKESLSAAVPGVRDIRVTPTRNYYAVELYHQNDKGTDNKGAWFDLSLESAGTIRLLAMLTVLFQEHPPSLVGLEEPESAMHPGAMVVLADAMKEASLRGQIVITTHSPDLINLFPIESIRAVTAEGGSTKVGRVAEHQLKSVKDNLFLPGELHGMEGLQPAAAEQSRA